MLKKYDKMAKETLKEKLKNLVSNTKFQKTAIGTLVVANLVLYSYLAQTDSKPENISQVAIKIDDAHKYNPNLLTHPISDNPHHYRIG